MESVGPSLLTPVDGAWCQPREQEHLPHVLPVLSLCCLWHLLGHSVGWFILLDWSQSREKKKEIRTLVLVFAWVMVVEGTDTGGKEQWGSLRLPRLRLGQQHEIWWGKSSSPGLVSDILDRLGCLWNHNQIPHVNVFILIIVWRNLLVSTFQSKHHELPKIWSWMWTCCSTGTEVYQPYNTDECLWKTNP